MGINGEGGNLLGAEGPLVTLGSISINRILKKYMRSYVLKRGK